MWRWWTLARDHPRVRGEKASIASTSPRTSGSPPRTRGEVIQRAFCRGSTRITPAYAGRRKTDFAQKIGVRDHPRVRGEKVPPPVWSTHRTGSPPRTRGEASGRSPHTARQGITPAYAGRRPVPFLPNIIMRDHPRVRGEKLKGSQARAIMLGSPPRTRGEVYLLIMGLLVIGITPAYAGRRERFSCVIFSVPDHPRVRGEKLVWDVVCDFKRGSPPRTRGEEMLDEKLDAGIRITPAYAGRSR